MKSAERLESLLEYCKIKCGKDFRLDQHDAGWAGDPSIPKAERRQFADELLSQDVTNLAQAQELLYASDSWSLLVIFQAMDAAGKDGTIKHVMSGVNPQGCQVFSFKQPSAEELDHNFLWRYMTRLPERGRIGIFNRSYYEEVLVVKVHPRWITAQRIPDANPDAPHFWEHRYDDINAFEHHLQRNGTRVVKFFLHLSRDEQRKRFLKRLSDPEKHWKFNPSDLAERSHWDAYMQAYEQAIAATSTEWAPWHVIPADHKWVARALVAQILVRTIQGLDLKYPEVSDAQEQALDEARRQLEAEAQ
jgi:PPK2 family polyphosphate:nucleotide phosphotransferase